MRFMMIVKATEASEAGVLPTAEEIAEMGKFNEEMIKAGVMLAGDGLHPSSNGARVTFSKGKPTVTDGPFTEAKELIAGFWLIQARSLDEAVAWASRAPAFADGEIEIRQVFEVSDFALPPEEAAHQEAMREELQRRAAER